MISRLTFFGKLIAGIIIVAILYSTSLIVSCTQKPHGYGKSVRTERPSKFKKGDVVYLKPDSLKVVIIGICPCSKNSYTVRYFDKDDHKVQMDVDEELIF